MKTLKLTPDSWDQIKDELKKLDSLRIFMLNGNMKTFLGFNVQKVYVNNNLEIHLNFRNEQRRVDFLVRFSTLIKNPYKHHFMLG